MKAENELQIMMDFHEGLFFTRQKCLDHLFCVVGNGYEWKNGELVSIEKDERIERYKLKKDVKKAKPNPFTEQFYSRIEELNNLDKSEISNRWYPISEKYSYICNYPDDIKPDWLNLINECKEMLEKDGIEVPENRPYSYSKETD